MNEEISKSIKQGKLVNTIIIIVAVIAFLIITGMNIRATSSSLTQSSALALLSFLNIFVWVYRIVAVAVLVFAIVTYLNMKQFNVKGSTLMLISAIVLTGFAMFTLVFGIVTFVLSGISMKQMKEFESKENMKLMFEKEDSIKQE